MFFFFTFSIQNIEVKSQSIALDQLTPKKIPLSIYWQDKQNSQVQSHWYKILSDGVPIG